MLQTYLIGCSFDAFTPSLSSRSYIVMLILVAWLLPLFLLFSSYAAIFWTVRSGLLLWTEMPNVAEEQRRKVTEASNCKA